MCLMCVGAIPGAVPGAVVPLLNEVLEALNFSSLANVDDALNSLYTFLCKSSFDFKAVKEGDTAALYIFRTVHLHKIIDICKQNKELITQLNKLSVKPGVTSIAQVVAITVGTGTKVTMKFGAQFGVGKAASQTVKMALNTFTNSAGMVADITQAGLEVTGHREIGKKVGMWGNIGAGAVAGATGFGPVGAFIGALAAFGSWIIGEGVSRATQDNLSQISYSLS